MYTRQYLDKRKTLQMEKGEKQRTGSVIDCGQSNLELPVNRFRLWEETHVCTGRTCEDCRTCESSHSRPGDLTLYQCTKQI